MTQILSKQTPTTTATLASSHPVPPIPAAMDRIDTWAALYLALRVAVDIPVVGGEASAITGGRTAQYGPVIRLEVQRLAGDKIGVPGARAITVYPEADQAPGVLAKFLEQGRRVYVVQAQQGCWHYRTDRPCQAGF